MGESLEGTLERVLEGVVLVSIVKGLEEASRFASEMRDCASGGTIMSYDSLKGVRICARSADQYEEILRSGDTFFITRREFDGMTTIDLPGGSVLVCYPCSIHIMWA